MRLLEKLSLTQGVILTAVVTTMIFSYIYSARTRTFLEHTIREVEEARRTVSRIENIQDQYANLLLLVTFRSPGADPAELNRLERESEEESKRLGIPFTDSVRGMKLVANYNGSRRAMRGLQIKIQEAVAEKRPQGEIAGKFEAWRWAEEFNDASLRDLTGYLSAREFVAISELSQLARFGFSTLVLLFLITLAVLALSSSYFYRTLIQPLRTLERSVKEVAEGGLGVRLKARTRDEVGGLTTSFNFMAERLDNRTRELAVVQESLKKMIAVAMRDLRSPLSTLVSFQKILMRSDLAPKRRQELTHLVGEVVERSLKVVDAMLADAVQASCEFEPREIDAANEFKRILSDLAEELKVTGGQVEVGDLPRLKADPMQFRELFRNLIANALKYHKPGVPPEVRVTGRTVEAKGQRVCQFDVADNGVGFDDRRQEELFAPYRSGASGAGDETGMGLSVCKEIVERHGGSIRARSRGGDGTVFTVQIPQDLPHHSA